MKKKYFNRRFQVAGEEGATNLLVICDDNDGDDENSEDHDKNDDGFANYNLQDCQSSILMITGCAAPF